MTCPAVKREIFYLLPQGKPNPLLPRKAELVDTREQVEQPPQKGPTCWYYALKILREQYGQHPDSSFLEDRTLEELASRYRKELTAANVLAQEESSIAALFKLSPFNQCSLVHSSAPEYSMKRSQQKAALLASPLFPSTEAKTKCAKVFELLDSFVTQTQCHDVQKFALQKHRQRLIQIHTRYLKVFKTDPEESYKKDLPNLPWHPAWKDLTEVEKVTYLSTLAIRVIAQNCYHLKESSWHPMHTVESLIDALHDKGPLFVSGWFGRSFYKNDPVPTSEKIHGKTILCWPAATAIPDTTPKPSHSVVIIGATTKGSRGGVIFFVDPQDGSSPSDPDKQKIYAISYQRLIENIHDLFGKHYFLNVGERHNPKLCYALQGALPLKPE